MPDTTDVAIIGGGAAGCAVAYYLAQSGVRSTIIEREGIGNQASGNAAGGLNPLTGIGIPGPLAAFGWECFKLHADLYQSLMDQSGIDYQHRTVAKIDLAMEESEIDGLKETAERMDADEGFEAHCWSRRMSPSSSQGSRPASWAACTTTATPASTATN